LTAVSALLSHLYAHVSVVFKQV